MELILSILFLLVIIAVIGLALMGMPAKVWVPVMLVIGALSIGLGLGGSSDARDP